MKVNKNLKNCIDNSLRLDKLKLLTKRTYKIH